MGDLGFPCHLVRLTPTQRKAEGASVARSRSMAVAPRPAEFRPIHAHGEQRQHQEEERPGLPSAVDRGTGNREPKAKLDGLALCPPLTPALFPLRGERCVFRRGGRRWTMRGQPARSPSPQREEGRGEGRAQREHAACCDWLWKGMKSNGRPRCEIVGSWAKGDWRAEASQ
jgi:hypothetical protein